MSVRYRLATVTGITSPVYVSLELAEDIIKHTDPADDKVKLSGGATNRMASGEIRTEVDCSALWDTEASSVAVAFQDLAGASDLTITLPKVRFSKWKGETGVDDTRPGKFSLNFEGEVPA